MVSFDRPFAFNWLLIGDYYFFVLYSMVVMGFCDGAGMGRLFPDRRDYQQYVIGNQYTQITVNCCRNSRSSRPTRTGSASQNAMPSNRSGSGATSVNVLSPRGDPGAADAEHAYIELAAERSNLRARLGAAAAGSASARRRGLAAWSPAKGTRRSTSVCSSTPNTRSGA